MNKGENHIERTKKQGVAHRSELLMPAGSLEKLKTAILYGADAVYCGTPDMSLRTKSAFSLEELLEGIRFAHERGKRVYLTLNLFSHNKDIEKLPLFVETVRKVAPDGVIIADPGVFQFVKEHAPELPLHISTQANVCSWLTVDYWKNQGASLCVLAREVSFRELSEIRKKCPDIKLEAFVHGSMCMTYSGRCLLSNFMAERGSNQGNCAHSCRWNYTLHLRLKDGTIKELNINEENKEMFEFLMEEEFRPGDFLPIEEDSRGAYILNSKDMCLMPKLDQYLELGIDSLKVEGRHKTAFYAAVVAHAYRRAIDDWYRDPQSWDPESYMKELEVLQNRGYTLAFHEGRLTNLAHNYEHSASVSDHEFAGFVREWDGDDMIFEIKNLIVAGDLIEFLSPSHRKPELCEGASVTSIIPSETVRVRLAEFTDAVTGEVSQKVSGGQNKAIRIPSAIFKSVPADKLRELLPVYTVAHKQKTPCESRVPKSVRNAKAATFGKDACCGKGCNGCLIFWNDPRYATKRKLMEGKKMGEKL